MGIPTDCTEMTLRAHEDGTDSGFVSFTGYVVHHATMGTTRQTVFARVPLSEGEPGGFILMEQTPHRCTLSNCYTEEELRRLVPGAVIEAPETVATPDGFCECPERIWDPDSEAGDFHPDDLALAGATPREAKDGRTVVEAWAVQDPEDDAVFDHEDGDECFLRRLPGMKCPRCHKPLPPKEQPETGANAAG